MDAAVVETHSGVVFLLGDRAYKLKKPVDLGFLDWTSREVREAVCHREVELNRRLAPDVYLGVADVMGPDGLPLDHVIVMRRLPDERRLAVLVGTDEDLGAQIDAIAELLARFHAVAERGPAADEAAGVEATAARWAANTAGLAPFRGRLVEPEVVDAVDAEARRYLDGRRRAFDRRIAEGRACDGHGDLLADDVFCLGDGPRILDCLEFDDALRLGDGLADAAFLAMDLEHRGRPDLAERFLAGYRRAAGDRWPASLAHHHIAYRAQVRAKVAAIRADQRGLADPDPARLLALARRHLDAARVALVVVGGLPGTGKSTLAAGLGEAIGAEVIRSDEVRKELAGVPVGHSAAAGFGEGIYGTESTEATYREVLARARALLEEGASVVMDASWGRQRWRDVARATARETSSEAIEIECRCPPDVAAARMAGRAVQGGDPSDADERIAAAMAVVTDPWPDAVVLDTTAPDEELVAYASELVRRAGSAPPAPEP